ncbi:hypothetical protein AB0H34_08715 [Saccharopolyspora shandongensis]|uniref:hypothetical protein n=1 Tax=Saccharopolyspora shandongensis TaxID=418495 RepID=UPI0033F52466
MGGPPGVVELARGGLAPDRDARHVDGGAGEEGRGPWPEDQPVLLDGLVHALALAGERRAVEASRQVTDEGAIGHGDEQRIRRQFQVRRQVDGGLGFLVPPQRGGRRPLARAPEQFAQLGAVGLREGAYLHHGNDITHSPGAAAATSGTRTGGMTPRAALIVPGCGVRLGHDASRDIVVL